MLGISQEKSYRRICKNFTEEEKTEFEHMARDPLIYEKIANNIAPSLFGHNDVKKAIACLMFGGKYYHILFKGIFNNLN
jgi:DNA replication licensing factor MCM5